MDMEQGLTQQKKYKRSYWIDPKVQWSIIQKAVLLNIILVVFLYIADRIFYYRMEQMGKDLGFAPEHVYFLFLYSQQKYKAIAFFITAGVISIISIFLGVRFSHRLAGPIFRLKKELQRLNAGEKIDPIHLRDSDYFKELAEELNKLTEKLGLQNKK